MPVTHSHYCKHCERTYSCKLGLDCLLPGYDISKIHNCGERERYARQIARIVADYPACPYKCEKLPCVHDKFPMKVTESRKYFNTFYRPRMSQDSQGVWRSEQANDQTSHVLATENRAKRRNSILSNAASANGANIEPSGESAANRTAGALKAEFERSAIREMLAAIELNGSNVVVSQSSVNWLGSK